tara:strand:- start:18435 stop:18830 length:396 start_codon:yes stop_codon:yes gene_type:complete
MGADLIYVMVIMEVTEEVANERLKELTLQKVKEEHSDFWEWHEDDIIEGMDEWNDRDGDEKAFALMKEKIKVGLKLAYDCWTRGEWLRNITSFNIRGIKGIMTADMSWGDSWPELDELGIIRSLGITENDW